MDGTKPYYPAEWKDDQIMDVLFSPFRENREINPQSWDSKMKFWKEMIVDECRFAKSPVINPKLISYKFTRNDKKPVCFGRVLGELYKQGKIQRLSDFQASLNMGWISWGMDTFVKKPLSWTFSKVFSSGDTLDSNEEFIVPEILQEQAEVVLEHHYRNASNDTTEHLVEYIELVKQMEKICPDQQSLDLVLMQLCKDNKVSIAPTGQGPQDKIIRFAKKDRRSATPVSDLDLRILRLHKAESHLQNQVMQISDEMDRCKEDARLYLKKGLRNSAKNALRRKKTLEKILEKREGAVENIQVLITRIRDAENDKMILDAYADGTNAFKEMTAASGLNVDHIDDVMTDLQDVFDMQHEINASISHGPMDSTLDVSTADLELELKDILESNTDVADVDTDIPEKFSALSVTDEELPSVPTFDPAMMPRHSSSPSRSKVPTAPRTLKLT